MNTRFGSGDERVSSRQRGVRGRDETNQGASALRASLLRPRGDYRSILAADSMQRIAIIKARLPASVLTRLARDLNTTPLQFFLWMRISKSSLAKSLRIKRKLSLAESEFALSLATMIGLVQEICTQPDGSMPSRAAAWFGRWLQEPNPAFGGSAPGDWLDTATGRELVCNLLTQIESGTYG